MLGSAGTGKQAHHIIPWHMQGHRAIQKAAGSKDAFHLNELINGIPLDNTIHLGSHPAYDIRIEERLNLIDRNLNPKKPMMLF